jgi:hypothetical protein
MASNDRSNAFFFAALVAPPLITFGSTQLEYVGNSASGSGLGLIGFVGGIVLGFAFFSGATFRSPAVRVGASVAYLAAAIFGSLVVAFATSCSNGHCP